MAPISIQLKITNITSVPITISDMSNNNMLQINPSFQPVTWTGTYDIENYDAQGGLLVNNVGKNQLFVKFQYASLTTTLAELILCPSVRTECVNNGNTVNYGNYSVTATKTGENDYSITIVDTTKCSI